jgi:2-keto-3-deoxy-L-rhamnonate aldolase RhmA
MTELAGVCGHFDYIEYDAEYSPCSQIDMENIARAAELHGMGSLIKVDFQNRGFVALKAVAAGFQGVLFTDHRTPEDFRESVRMMRSETPSAGGQFGYPSRRFIGAQTYMPQMDHAKRVDQVVLAFMIEKAEAVERIEEICAVPGIDMVQFGPSDYCLSMGWNMDEHREEVRKAEQKVIQTALAHGIRPRCEIPNAQAATYYVELGVKDFCVGDEIASFRQFLSKEGSAIQNIIQASFQ